MAFWSNFHSHSVFCDGRAPMEDFVRFAMAKKVSSYGFSAHGPLPFHTSWNMDLDNLPYYKTEFQRLKNKYAGEINLFIGLEMDFIHNYFESKNDLYDTSDFDYLISSVHYLDKLPDGHFFTVDGIFFDFNKGIKILYDGDIRIATERYFEIYREMLQKGGFDIAGHVDKIMLNGSQCADFNFNQSWYRNLMGEILELIKKEKYILEINTKSFFEKGFTYPDTSFFPLINELKIPLILSSDCHYPDKVIDGFEQVYMLLKKAGFKELMELTQNGWVNVPMI